jgi:hypothetical protein
MRTLIVAVAGLLVVCASPIHAADSGSRTYADPSCSDRNANAADCVVQDGPSRRASAGTPPAAQKDTATPASQPAGVSLGKGVAAGSGNTSSSGSAAARK